jgi:hypothetical protein
VIAITLLRAKHVLETHAALLALEGQEAGRDALQALIACIFIIGAGFCLWLTFNAALVWLVWGSIVRILLCVGALNMSAIVFGLVTCMRVAQRPRFATSKQELAHTLHMFVEGA